MDEKLEQNLQNFYSVGSKIKNTEITLLLLTILVIGGAVAYLVYAFITKKFIFDTYERKEGPPGTMPNKKTNPTGEN